MSVQLNQPKYFMRESRREYPPFLIAVTLIESEHMLNNAQSVQLLRTVSGILGLKPYLSQGEVRCGMN